MTSYDDYFLGDIETGEIWSRDEFYKFKFEGYIVSNFMGLVSLLNCLKKENGQLKKNCKNYEWYKQYKALLNENEQLKKQHRELQIEYNDACGIIHDLRENKLDLEDENEQLKQALKNSYINEICENCKYGHYWISETFGFGLEGEFECTKKHFGNDHWKCDGLTECDEFELEIKGDV